MLEFRSAPVPEDKRWPSYGVEVEGNSHMPGYAIRAGRSDKRDHIGIGDS